MPETQSRRSIAYPTPSWTFPSSTVSAPSVPGPNPQVEHRTAASEVVEGDQADGLVTFDDPETLSGFTVEVTVADPASGLLLGNDSRDVERPGLTGQEADQGISVVGDETPEGEIHGPESYGSR